MDYVGYLYALLIMVGGLVGYIKSGSGMALGMGLLFGCLAGYGAYRASANPDAVSVGLLVSLAMTARFGQYYFTTGQVMPGGMVALISLLVALKYGVRLFL